ncbi:MAG: 23S rRNA (uracil(1939)-C(5))-methyltransferase RlmD [Clostridia bacterium]|nr:23S rRNA (uracil(1939)-C(5))-methyltransferase RlmD [Clostridia bacterium]
MRSCPYSRKCSGCQLQNLTYEEQLQMKQVKLIRLLGKYCHVDEIIGMESPLNYRNKAQSAFGFKNGKIISGIYQSTTQKIIEVKSCMLEDQQAEKIVNTIKNLAIKYKVKAYDLNTGKGFLRHVLVRKGFKTGEIMVVLVTTKGDFLSSEQFVQELVKIHKEITTVVWNINPTETPLFLGPQSKALYGDGYIKDTLCQLDFRISPSSFYQVNPVQTEILYTKAKEYAGLTGKEVVIDAYCGTGTIGLTMAKHAKKIIGVEANSNAIEDARVNAKLNGIENAIFYNQDAGELMSQLANKKEKVDVVITDPPRAGCSQKFLKSLIELSPKRVVYISCNPDTLVNDLHTLTKSGYKVKKIQPVDMFPYTNHVESVMCLTKK